MELYHLIGAVPGVWAGLWRRLEEIRMVNPLKYPAWRYHRTEPARIIASPKDEAVGWFDSPAKVALGSEPPAELPEKPEEPEEPVVVAEVKKKPAKPVVKAEPKVLV